MDIFHYPLILTNTTYYRWYASVRLVNTEPGDSGKYDPLQKTGIRQFVVKWKCECTGSWETEVRLLLRKNKKHNARNQTGNQKSTYKLKLVTETLTWEESWTQTRLKEDDCPQEFTGIKLQEEICDQQLSEFYYLCLVTALREQNILSWLLMIRSQSDAPVPGLTAHVESSQWTKNQEHTFVTRKGKIW